MISLDTAHRFSNQPDPMRAQSVRHTSATPKVSSWTPIAAPLYRIDFVEVSVVSPTGFEPVTH